LFPGLEDALSLKLEPRFLGKTEHCRGEKCLSRSLLGKTDCLSPGERTWVPVGDQISLGRGEKKKKKSKGDGFAVEDGGVGFTGDHGIIFVVISAWELGREMLEI